ncbi:hypothetical protein [Cupriavidus sp. UYPR2.512]|uniref:hypothetical protein n=1 Tax=Cupriavidus sp. UYPR2.512 TaxID=1080187 RepID=UPI00036E2646|nr:hypothetical protein [Cupriavidus sp. UYPR2.512]UIF90934.1 hypothetical protein KAF44_32640 [Cupriavidus necator]
MASININGNIVSGRSITITNGRVTVDGKDVTPDGKAISIEVQGNIDSINADACDRIAVTGSAGSVKTMSGDIRCGDVSGSVQSMSGDVTCGAVAGSVSSMSGDIRRG